MGFLDDIGIGGIGDAIKKFDPLTNIVFGGADPSDIKTHDPLDLIGGLTGSTDAAEAAEEAASSQAQATVRAAQIQREGLGEALELQRESRDLARQDLAPFRQAGQSQLAEIQNLLTPEGQTSFIQDNPFFEFLAQDAQRRIFNQAGASGRGFSGGTAQALQNSIMLLGNDLVGQDLQRRGSLASLGQASAAGQAAAAQNFGQQAGSATLGTNATIADLITQGANATAAGQVGAANARAQGLQTAGTVGLGIAGLAMSDRRFKRDIEYLGTERGVPWYLFRYIWDDQVYLGTMADEVRHLGAVVNIDGIDFVDYGKL